MQSDKLRHFPENDPVDRHYANETQRQEIARQTKEFLAKGGKITTHDSSENFGVIWHQPRNAKQTRELKKRLSTTHHGDLR